MGLQTRLCRIELQIERRSLCGARLLAGQLWLSVNVSVIRKATSVSLSLREGSREIIQILTTPNSYCQLEAPKYYFLAIQLVQVDLSPTFKDRATDRIWWSDAIREVGSLLELRRYM